MQTSFFLNGPTFLFLSHLQSKEKRSPQMQEEEEKQDLYHTILYFNYEQYPKFRISLLSFLAIQFLIKIVVLWTGVSGSYVVASSLFCPSGLVSYVHNIPPLCSSPKKTFPLLCFSHLSDTPSFHVAGLHSDGHYS